MYLIQTTLIADKINHIFNSFDMFFFKLLGGVQSNFLTEIEKAITFLGDGKFIAIILLASIVMLLFKKTRKIGSCVIIALVLSTVITNVILKPVIMRPRPYIYLKNNLQFLNWYLNVGSPVESDYSFPSGHTTAAFSYCTALFLTLRKKYKASYIFPLIAILVMISRVYLMVHFASDVLFGMIVGTICATVACHLSPVLSKLISKTPLDKFDLKEKLNSLSTV